MERTTNINTKEIIINTIASTNQLLWYTSIYNWYYTSPHIDYDILDKELKLTRGPFYIFYTTYNKAHITHINDQLQLTIYKPHIYTKQHPLDKLKLEPEHTLPNSFNPRQYWLKTIQTHDLNDPNSITKITQIINKTTPTY